MLFRSRAAPTASSPTPATRGRPGSQGTLGSRGITKNHTQQTPTPPMYQISPSPNKTKPKDNEISTSIRSTNTDGTGTQLLNPLVHKATLRQQEYTKDNSNSKKTAQLQPVNNFLIHYIPSLICWPAIFILDKKLKSSTGSNTRHSYVQLSVREHRVPKINTYLRQIGRASCRERVLRLV